jgi:hypothetical protein
MKVFRFDPATGVRGERVPDRPRASWASGYYQGYAGAKPTGFSHDSEVTVHCDAGVTSHDGSEDISYRHPTEWICFCLGCWHCGVNEDGTTDEHWEWVVLPPMTEEIS